MPLFEYKCLVCGAVFEKIRKVAMTEFAPTCPRCASSIIEPQVTAPAFHLKGTGWAKDNYGGNG